MRKNQTAQNAAASSERSAQAASMHEAITCAEFATRNFDSKLKRRKQRSPQSIRFNRQLD